MKELITVLLLYIASNTSYSIDYPLPQVKEMDIIMSEIIFPDYEGFYDYNKNIIYLRKELDLKDPWAQAILLHELVHYIQDMNNIYFECTAEMEKEAWLLQQKYLKEQYGIIWNYDKLWYIVISNCGQY